jgi:hypothetical protein
VHVKITIDVYPACLIPKPPAPRLGVQPRPCCGDHSHVFSLDTNPNAIPSQCLYTENLYARYRRRKQKYGLGNMNLDKLLEPPFVSDCAAELTPISSATTSLLF